MKKTIQRTFVLLTLTFSIIACKKENPIPQPEPINETPTYTIPTTYNFGNADFKSSTQRLAMLTELVNYLRATHTTTAAAQPTVSAQKLKNMYINAASQFTDTELNTSGIQLKDKTGNAYSFQNELEKSFDDAELASITAAANPTITTASNGARGKLISPSRAILVNAYGFEYKETAEKGLMGALLYHQAMTLLSGIANFDNTIKLEGITAQEKAWDEAFGYFGVPITFPTNTVGLKYWGLYCNSVNAAIGSNKIIMEAFLKGRAAISNNNASARDEAKTTVINTWEKVAAAKCISYLKGAKNNLADAATLHHNLSEGYGFVTAFRYNPAKNISDADINILLSYFGTNLYGLNTSNIDLAIAKLEAVFSLNAAIIP